MKFRTELDIVKFRPSFSLDPNKPVIAVGSCFAANIAEKMRESLWEVSTPFGTLYNPFSISTAIRSALSQDKETYEKSIFCHNGIYHSILGDSSFSSRSAEDVVTRLVAGANAFNQFLNLSRNDESERFKGKSCQPSITLIVTFGTAWCYFLREDPRKVVANCHKLPTECFTRRRITVEEIINDWDKLLRLLNNRFPALQIILTVSPVRHLKDGFHENTLSKATLQMAAEEICSRHHYCHYFPAYEIIIDDLRDYRFYAEDMTHPSDKAINYIWQKFQECYLTPDGMKILKEGENLFKGLGHRSILETEEERKARIELIKEKIKIFKGKNR